MKVGYLVAGQHLVTQIRAVRRLYSVGGAPVNFGRRRLKTSAAAARPGVIFFYAQVFQLKQPSHSHTLTL